MLTATVGDKTVSGRKKWIGIRPDLVNRNPSFVLKMHLQFYIYAVCMVSFVYVM